MGGAVTRVGRFLGIVVAILLVSPIAAEATAIQGSVFINEDVSINQYGMNIASINKTFTNVDSSMVNTSSGQFVFQNVTTSQNNLGGLSATTSSGSTTVTWTPSSTLPANGDTLHVGVWLDGSSLSNGGTTQEDPGNASFFADLVPVGGGSTTQVDLPEIDASVSTTGGSTSVFEYLVEVFTATVGAVSVTNWLEVPVPVGAQDKKVFVNPFAQDITLSDAGFMMSDTQIPLDTLNLDSLPPNDPQFQPIPGIPNGAILPAGGQLVPEPSSAWLAAVGVAGLMAARRRARRSVR